MSEDILEAATRLLDGITPGRWLQDHEGRHFVYVHPDDAGPPTGPPGDTDEDRAFYHGPLIAESVFNPADMRFIAAAPELVWRLAREVERLRKQNR